MQAYPLLWPIGWHRTKFPRRSRFDCTFALARDGIINEIRLLGGKKIIISTNNELKRDGYPYANQRQPEDRGVAVYFEYKTKQMVFACDMWDRIEHNLQGIYKTISAMRGIERWGVSDMIERTFNGFKAIPEKTNSNENEPWFVILNVSPECNVDELKLAYRRQAKRYHPDNKSFGNEKKFINIKKAYDYALKLKETSEIR